MSTNTNTTKAPKITKAQRFNEIRTMIPEDRTDLLEFIDHELALLDRKNKADRKPTAKEVQTAELREQLYNEVVEAGKPVTISELMENSTIFAKAAGMSPQRVTALMNGLRTDGRVVRETVNHKSYFAAVVAE